MAVTDWKSPGTTANDNSNGGNDAWGQTDRVKKQDDKYSEATGTGDDASQYLLTTNYLFDTDDIPLVNVIKGIQVRADALDGGGTDPAVNLESLIVKGGTIGTDSHNGFLYKQVDDDTYTVLPLIGSETELWGETWLPSDIHSSGFGFAFSVDTEGGPGDWSAKIDHIQIRVFHIIDLGQITAQTIYIS